MNQDLLSRVQENIAKVDKLKVSKIEAETKIKALEESITEDLNKAKELGYNNLEELLTAQRDLEASIKAECESIEKAFIEAGV